MSLIVARLLRDGVVPILERTQVGITLGAFYNLMFNSGHGSPGFPCFRFVDRYGQG